MMQSNNNYNPLFDMIFEEDQTKEGSIDDCKIFLSEYKGFKLFHMNVCGLRSKHSELVALFHALQADFDCIALTEGHINTEVMNINQYSFTGYNAYCSKYNTRKTDGVAIFIKSSLEHTVREIKMKDANCMHVELIKDKTKISCTAIYRSPSGKIENFIGELSNTLSQLGQRRGIGILTGDININLIDSKSLLVQQYLNLMSENGYMCLIKKATRVTKKSKSSIDHIFVKKDIDNSLGTFILHSNTSDHFSTLLNLDLISQNEADKSKYTTYTETNYEQLNALLREEKWEDIYKSEDPNVGIDIFVHKMQEFISRCTTQKTIKQHNKLKSWTTQGIITSIKKRDKLHLVCRKQPFNKQAQEMYKKYRNKLNKIITEARNKYYREKIEQAEGNKRKIWSIINEVTQYKQKKCNEIKKIEVDDVIVGVECDPLRIANYFNKYYSQTGVAASRQNGGNFNRSSVALSVSDLSRDPNLSTLYLSKISSREIEDVINGLKGRTAPGHDGIKTEVLKYVKNVISNPLSYIFNLNLKEGVFPKQFKHAIISPIHKKGPEHLVQNYRPISLLTGVTKIFERCIKKRLLKFLEENKILSETQFGFRPGMSTDDAVLELIEGVQNTLDEGKKGAAVLMDLSKAFETVQHDTLINILYRNGVRGVPLKLFESYLGNRSQQVKISMFSKKDDTSVIQTDILSNKINNEPFSVPQGTVLSPLLYIIYVNGLYNLRLKGKLVTFADDTALFVSGNTWNEVITNIQTDMLNIKAWFLQHNLFLNMSKTKLVPFANDARTMPEIQPIKIHEQHPCRANCTCEEIEMVRHWKYLGLEIDCHLRWDQHINMLVKRIRRYIYPFLSLRNFMPLKLLKQVYYALVQSVLEYGIIAYGRADQSNIQNLKVIQNLILKLLYKKKKRFSTKRLYGELDVLNIENLFKKNVCIKVHKNKDKLISYIDYKYSLRNKNPIVNKCNTKKGQKSIKFLGLKLYKSLPDDLQSCKTKDKFKSLLKDWLKKNVLKVT